MTTSRASFWNPFFLITFIIWCFSPAWLFCYAFCICLLTFRYQKYKSVDLGDQLVSPQPDCPNLCRRLHWCCRASSPHRPSCSCNLVSFCQQLNIHRMIFKYICNFVFNRQSMSKDFQLCSFIGISQSVLATSYVKWIDVWMIFTMIVPFLEVRTMLAKGGKMVEFCEKRTSMGDGSPF